MAGTKRHWLLLLFLLLFILLFWYKYGQRHEPTAKTSEKLLGTSDRLSIGSAHQPIEARTPPSQSPGLVFGPSYFPANEARFKEPSRPSEFLLMGRVLSDRDEPLPGAVVSLHNSRPEFPEYQWPEAFVTQTCDLEGRFRISVGSPVSASVSVRKDGFTAKEDLIDFAGEPTIVKSYRLSSAPACAEGYVRDKKGIPIRGAAVRASIFSAFPGGTSLDALGFCPPVGLTNSAGRYVIQDLPEGPGVSLSARAPNYVAPEPESIRLAAGKCARVDFRLEDALVFSFHVSNTQGESIPSANAVPQGSDAPGSARGDKNGMMIFTVPPDATPFECLVHAPGYKARNIRLDPKDPPVQVTLEDGQVFTGKVINESGEPVSDVKVFITVENNLRRENANSDNVGRFYLKSGEMNVTGLVAFKQGYLEQRLTFADNHPVYSGIEICLIRPQGGIFGRVTDAAGNPVKLFNVRFSPGAWMSSYFRSFENERGSFTVSDVPPGAYDVTFFSVPNSRLERSQELLIRQLEIRKGYYLGEISVQFPPPRQNK